MSTYTGTYLLFKHHMEHLRPAPEPTTRNGRLKTHRRGRGRLMLREDLASFEFVSEDIIVDYLR